MTKFKAMRLLQSYKAYVAKKNGYSTDEVAERYGMTTRGVNYRVAMVKGYVADGSITERLNSARSTLSTYGYSNVSSKPEKLPVRCASGCRLSPLY